MGIGGGDLDNAVQINGGTDGTLIGNSGDRLKIDSASSADTYTSYSPDYGSFPDGSSNLITDGASRLETHSTVLTDEGTYRDDFVGVSLTSSIGSASWTNNGLTVTGTGFFSTLKNGDYIKKTADADTAYVRIASVDSNTSLTLETPYTGTTATAASIESSWVPSIGTGGSIGVASSLVTLNSGTTNGSATSIRRDGDYLPYVAQFKVSVSQRIANQITQIGLVDSVGSIAKSAMVQFDGTSSNTIKFVTSISAAVADTQTTTVTVSGLNTSSLNSYAISLTNNQASLIVNGKCVAIHTDHMPGPYDILSLVVKVSNQAVVTTTAVAVDWALFYNTDQVEVAGNFQGEPQKVLLQGASVTTGLPIDLQLDQNGNLIVTALGGFGANFSYGDVNTSALTKVVVRRTTYTEQTTNAQRSIASASANDAAAGTGARTIEITYFDQTGAGPFTETVTFNGTTFVNTVNTNICFIEKMIVLTAGSGGVNAGILTLKAATAGGGATIGTINTGDNRTFWAHHYIAISKVCKISGLSVNHNGTTVGSGGVFAVNAIPIGVANAAINQVSDFHRLYGQSSTIARSYASPIIVNGPAKLEVVVTPESASASVYRASIDFSEQ